MLKCTITLSECFTCTQPNASVKLENWSQDGAVLKIEAKSEIHRVPHLASQVQCWIDGGFHASPLHSHQCWVSQCKALCCTVRTVCTACCTGQETKSSTVGVQKSQHPFQQSRWRWWPGGKVKSAAKVKLPEGRHFGTNCSESQYCKENLFIQF